MSKEFERIPTSEGEAGSGAEGEAGSGAEGEAGSGVESKTMGVGESVEEQSAPVPIIVPVAKARFLEIIENNTNVINDSKKMLDLLEADPTLDASLVRLFGITRTVK